MVPCVKERKNSCKVPEALICTGKYCCDILWCLLAPDIAHIFTKTVTAILVYLSKKIKYVFLLTGSELTRSMGAMLIF